MKVGVNDPQPRNFYRSRCLLPFSGTSDHSRLLFRISNSSATKVSQQPVWAQTTFFSLEEAVVQNTGEEKTRSHDCSCISGQSIQPPRALIPPAKRMLPRRPAFFPSASPCPARLTVGIDQILLRLRCHTIACATQVPPALRTIIGRTSP